jgi:hypothetical protein
MSKGIIMLLRCGTTMIAIVNLWLGHWIGNANVMSGNTPDCLVSMLFVS